MSLNQYSPRNAATVYIKFDELSEEMRKLRPYDPYAFEWALANTLIHELSHAASRGRVGHCQELSCVMHPNLSDYFLRQMGHGSVLYIGRRRTYNVPLGPWHSVDEVFAIREGIGLNRLSEDWLQQR